MADAAGSRGICAYACGRAPVELIEAAGLSPVPLAGAVGRAADPLLPGNLCPLAAPVAALAGGAGAVDSGDAADAGARPEAVRALVCAACLPGQRFFDVLDERRPALRPVLIELPRQDGTAAREYVAAQLQRAGESLAGRAVAAAALQAALDAWDEAARAYRAVVGDLARRPAGTAAGLVAALAAGGTAATLATRLADLPGAGATASVAGGTASGPRALVVAGASDAGALCLAVERAGLVVAGVDACLARHLETDRPLAADPVLAAGPASPWLALSRRCLAGACAAAAALPARVERLARAATATSARVAVLAAARGCPLQAYEAAALDAALRRMGLLTVLVEAADGAEDARRLAAQLEAATAVATAATAAAATATTAAWR